ncbi:hypothetical protein CUMW_109660 [Citrus unshiu]|nr:hypothetical protein CUMW_109660 [Citrus unshiu]
MTLNSEMTIPEMTNSRRQCGRISTSDFHRRPTNNPNVFNSRMRAISLISTITTNSTGVEDQEINPEYTAWIKTDQLILRWMMSSIQQNLLATVIHYSTVKGLLDKLTTLAGKPVELNDLIQYVLTGLDSSYYKSPVTSVLARGDKINLDEFYSLLLSHENRVE